MSRVKNFPTGSQFVGDYNCTLRTMHGFGRYIFPDKSEYSGFFHYGRFHGYGTMHVTQPVPMTYKGQFEFGKLKKLEHIQFQDGLTVEGAVMEKHRMNFSQWRYCTAKNRCYHSELTSGLDAVGPGIHLTNSTEPRHLRYNEYDVGDGVYLPSTGFVSQRRKPFNKFRFVACNAENEWILKNCRRGGPDNKALVCNFPNAGVRKSIIDTNLRAMKRLEEPQFECPCNTELQQKNYFRDLCTLLQRTGYESVETMFEENVGKLRINQSDSSKDVTSAASKIAVSDSITPSATSLSDESLQLNFAAERKKSYGQSESGLIDNKSSMSIKESRNLLVVPSYLSTTINYE